MKIDLSNKKYVEHYGCGQPAANCCVLATCNKDFCMSD